MKELLSPYMGRGTWKNFELLPLDRRGGVAKYELGGGGVGERKDMNHVNSELPLL